MTNTIDDDTLLILFRLKTLNKIGVALSAEKNTMRLFEMILKEAKRIAYADGGTLYIKTQDHQLKFEIMISNSLNLHTGGTTGIPINLPSLPLYNEKGQANLDKVAVCAAITGRTINVSDAYANTEFEFSGTQEFDHRMGYHSQSFLTVPMKDHNDEVIGVLQLINALDPVTRKVTTFGPFEQELVESLASQAAVALSNQRLIEEQRRLFESFIQIIAKAIDEKSPATAGHCRRVPELTMMLAEAACKTKVGPLKNFTMSEEEYYQLKVAGWLHDCGKIITPEYLINKATKLENIFDRIHLIDTRFEVLKRDAEISLLRQQLSAYETGEKIDRNVLNEKLNQEINTLNEERDFLHGCNRGSETLFEGCKERVQQIAQRKWLSPNGQESPFLSENEVRSLTIHRGTLLPEEREIIKHHINATLKMLEALPYPKYLKNIPEYAGGHHERMDGKGYPRGLTRDQLSIPARVVGIADIFEALTAQDRPYKKPMCLSEALKILGHLKEEQHIDPDLFDVFIHEKVYLRYAEKFLPPEQIDEFDVTQLPGYSPLRIEH